MRVRRLRTGVGFVEVLCSLYIFVDGSPTCGGPASFFKILFSFFRFGFYFESDFHFVYLLMFEMLAFLRFNPAAILLTYNVEVLILAFYPLRRLSRYRGMF